MGQIQRCFFLLAAAATNFLTFSMPAYAHSFGVRYDLPLPLWLYITGAGAAIAISFVIMSISVKQPARQIDKFGVSLASIPVLRIMGHRTFICFVQIIAASVFFLLLATSLFGSTDPFKNLAPTFIWVVWWVGMAFISGLIGDLWRLINPWNILFSWAEELFKVRGKIRAYPEWLSYWPAFLLFLIFAWLELISDQGENPRSLAMLIMVYSAITWAGMAVFGRKTWLQRGEIFSVTFGLLARMAPIGLKEGQVYIRPYAVGLLDNKPLRFSMVCFVLLLLTSVTFDGILETPLWANILDAIAQSQVLRSTLIALQNSGINLVILIKTLALIFLPLVFVTMYTFVCIGISWAGNYSGRLSDILGYFALSLVPIAIAYHLSHYISYLMIAGQNIIPLASDPFGIGWDLFGTASYRINLGIVNAKLVWIVSVTAIVVGHAIAVYIAHTMALRVFSDRMSAFYSQIPMLVLMVFYTMLSLWILSQPIIA